MVDLGFDPAVFDGRLFPLVPAAVAHPVVDLFNRHFAAGVGNLLGQRPAVSGERPLHRRADPEGIGPPGFNPDHFARFIEDERAVFVYKSHGKWLLSQNVRKSFFAALPFSLPSEARPFETGLPRPVLRGRNGRCGRGGQRVQGPAGPGRVQRQSLWSHPRGTLGRCHKGSEINIRAQSCSRLVCMIQLYCKCRRLSPVILRKTGTILLF